MSKDAYVYRVLYLMHGDEQEVIVSTLYDVMMGFWVTEDLEYTKEADAKHWIPYHVVLCVTREKLL